MIAIHPRTGAIQHKPAKVHMIDDDALPTSFASDGSDGAVPVWSKGPVLRAYSADRARVLTQWP